MEACFVGSSLIFTEITIMWYRIAAQGIMDLPVDIQEINDLIENSVAREDNNITLNHATFESGLKLLFPGKINNVVFRKMLREYATYNYKNRTLAIRGEFPENELVSFKKVLMHEIQHVIDPRYQKIPEKVSDWVRDARITSLFNLDTIDKNTEIPSYDQIIYNFFRTVKGRYPEDNVNDLFELMQIQKVVTREKYEEILERLKKGDNPYYNSPLEAPSQLQTIKEYFAPEKIMAIKEIISRDPSYTDDIHIDFMTSILKSPYSEGLEQIESCLLFKYPSLGEFKKPSQMLKLIKNKKFHQQFKKIIGNIILELGKM
jgi:hypothetical protein